MADLTPIQRQALEGAHCEVRSDELTKVLYATDASIYRITPTAVAFPTDVAECAEVVRRAVEAGVQVIPRGAGTGLAGGAIGEGLVVDLSCHFREIGPVDLESRTVKVGAGVVLDRLNRAVGEHGLWFGPDVATATRATLGGMIANNSSGAHAPVYGTTADHVEALEVVLADGATAWVGKDHNGFAGLRSEAAKIVQGHTEEIRRRLPDDLVKRRPAYDLHRFLDDPSDLAALICASEGTLGTVVSALLRLEPKPVTRDLGVVFFASVLEAMQAAVEIDALSPAAVEHLDRIVFEQSRGQAIFRAARDFLELDDRPCEAMLFVEFFDDGGERLEQLVKLKLGQRTTLCRSAAEQKLVWDLRRAGLSLATGCVGPAKPATIIEDACVKPEHLPAYVSGLQEILASRGLSASFYGHVASGLLHVRPTVDLHTLAGVDTLRELGEEVSALVLQFGGSLAGEHGVGITRTGQMKAHLGEELCGVCAEIKELFDPNGLLNPGKIVDTGRFAVDRDLRLGPGSTLELPFEPVLGFVEKDNSFVGNLEQCNGCGGCRKEAPTMCPTFSATGDEALSTRGRANTIRATLEGRFTDGLASLELYDALSSCLSCKACKNECPSGVDLAHLKAEVVHARHQTHGPSLADRIIAASDLLGRLGSATAPVANRMLAMPFVRRLMQRVIGIDAGRSLPPYASRRFDRWFSKHVAPASSGAGAVVLWDDTWVRYHEPGIGQAATLVIEALGLNVELAEGRKCCGRPAASRGMLDIVRRNAEHNIELLAASAPRPVVFLEPSCWSMFVDEYRQLGIDGADAVADRCVLFEDFMVQQLRERGDDLPFEAPGPRVVVHGHCHSKALTDPSVVLEMLAAVPGCEAELLNTGCCGMAGAFGMMAANQELSQAVAAPLVDQVGALPGDAKVVAAGTSCRHQIEDLAGHEVLHPAELLAAVLKSSSS